MVRGPWAPLLRTGALKFVVGRPHEDRASRTLGGWGASGLIRIAVAMRCQRDRPFAHPQAEEAILRARPF